MREEIDFKSTWRDIRQQGKRKYIMNRICTLGTMMFFIYIIDCVRGQEMDYMMQGIIDMILVVIMPFILWFINECRYKLTR